MTTHRHRRAYDNSILKNNGRLAGRVAEFVPVCWFCGIEEAKSTREHIVPLWLQKELGAESQTIAPFRFEMSTYLSTSQKELCSESQTIAPFRFEMSTGKSTHVRSEYSLKSLMCGQVCAKCNNGWMSKLEVAAKTPLMALINNQVVEDDDLAVIAQWVAKTAIALNASMPYRLLWNRADRHASRFGVPNRTVVGASWSRDRHDDDVNWQQGGPMLVFGPKTLADFDGVNGQIEQTYLLSLRLRNLVLHCVHQQPGRQFSVSGSFREIYPATPERVRLHWLPNHQPGGLVELALVDSPFFPT